MTIDPIPAGFSTRQDTKGTTPKKSRCTRRCIGIVSCKPLPWAGASANRLVLDRSLAELPDSQPPRARYSPERKRWTRARTGKERIQVASAAFSIRHQRDVLAAAESHLARERTSAADLKAALLKGLRQHVEDATETLRQRRWRKVVRIFVLLRLQPALLPFADAGRVGRQAGVAGAQEASAGGGTGGGRADPGRKGPDPGEAPKGNRSSVAAVVRGVSTLLDLPLPNNGDYTREQFRTRDFALP